MTDMPDYPWLREYVNVPPLLELPQQTIVQAFDGQVAKEPDRPLMWFHQDAITRAEFFEASCRLAHALTGLGIAPGDRVAVMGQNTPALALAMLASWRACAAVVPLNPMLKTAEVRGILLDSQATAVLADHELWQPLGPGACEGSRVRVIVLTGEQIDQATPLPPDPEGMLQTARLTDLIGNRSPGAAACSATPDDIAALVYTSGTTGGPKGAVIRHRHLGFTTDVYRQWMNITDADVILGAAPISHITGLVAGLTLALTTGAPLLLSGRFDARTIIRQAERRGATFVVAAITAYRAMLNDDALAAADLSALHKAYSGGAPVAAATVEQFERLTGVYIHPIYGLTETTSPSHATPLGVRAPVDSALGTLAVGVPIPNTYSAIIDPASRERLPAGQAGEVVIQGPGVVEEYWRKPDVTAAAIPEGLLYTGDIGFMDAAGWFYVIDRIKDVINTSGFKVWPREVEDVLLQHSGVAEAAVVGVPDPYRGETVQAYVVRRSNHDPSAEELIGFAKARLAAFKYPRRIEFCTQLPKTSSGKILRRALREGRIETTN